MLIEELIRLGRPVLESGLDAREILKLITDAADDRVKNFYRHVIVVELPLKGTAGEPAVLPIQNWQIEQRVEGRRKPEIDVDTERALGAAVSLPTGGNPLNPQGRYGTPIYPLYDPHFQAFRESAENVRGFLSGRVERTPGFSVNEATLNRIAARLHAAVAEHCGGPEKRLGVLVLARCEASGFFTYGDRDTRTHVGASVLSPGRYLEPDCGRIAEAASAARVEEGAGMGRRAGSCSVTGVGEAAVAAYCKAWPWAFPTWTCPVPHGGDTGLLVEGLALSEPSYRALNLGANIFHRLTRTLHYVVLPELFAPVENCDRQNAARSRKLSDLPPIFGSAFLLPVRDAILADPPDRNAFADAALAMLNAPEPAGPLAERYLTAVTGFDMFLPEELSRNEFRLTLVYFSGDVSRGDVHLRAYIQDVLPSTAGDLKQAVRSCRERMAELVRALSPNASDRQLAYLDPRYQSLPYLLARAYGGSHLWTLLEQCLHRRPLDERPVVAHVAARIRSVAPRWPKTRSEVADEVVFLLVCRDFIRRYNREVAKPPKEDAVPMRPWQELIRAYEREPFETMEFRSVAELGFACGLVVRRFSRWYYSAQEKDFLKHRVLTFGTDLGPRDIQRGVMTIRSVAAKFDDLRGWVEAGQLAYYPNEERKQHVGDYQRRLGAVLNALNSFSGEVEKSRDEFVSGFWSGYSLQGYDRPRAVDGAPASTNGGES